MKIKEGRALRVSFLSSCFAAAAPSLSLSLSPKIYKQTLSPTL